MLAKNMNVHAEYTALIVDHYAMGVQLVCAADFHARDNYTLKYTTNITTTVESVAVNSLGPNLKNKYGEPSFWQQQEPSFEDDDFLSK